MKNLLLLLIAFCCTGTAAQDIIPVKVLADTKTGPVQYLGTDAFGSVYTLKDNELRKQTGAVVQKYRNLSLGEVSRIDLQNPLQLVLFYKKFNTVVLLDNQMNETARIGFSDLRQPLIADAVGLAAQNRLWVYDITTQQIGLYTLSNGTFTPIVPPFAEPPAAYANDYNYFYWADATGKCFQVNLFGSVSALGSVPAQAQVQLLPPGAALYREGDVLYHYSFATQARTRIATVEKSFGSFHYAPQILSIFTANQINQYNITLPE